MMRLADDIEAYAALAAALADPSADRAALLAPHGLDELGWDALDAEWQERISAADEGPDGVPRLLVAYSEAFARAQRATVKVPLSFERFIEVTRELRRGVDVSKVLERLGVRLAAFTASQQHWMARMMVDEALAERFRLAMR